MPKDRANNFKLLSMNAEHYMSPFVLIIRSQDRIYWFYDRYFVANGRSDLIPRFRRTTVAEKMILEFSINLIAFKDIFDPLSAPKSRCETNGPCI